MNLDTNVGIAIKVCTGDSMLHVSIAQNQAVRWLVASETIAEENVGRYGKLSRVPHFS